MPDDFSVKEISQMLAAQMPALALALFPQGLRHGNEIWIGDISGAPGNSLKIMVAGPNAGFWKDFAGAADDRGDAIDLIQAVLHLDTAEAIRWAKNWLGLGSGMAARKTPPATSDEAAVAKRVSRALKIWHDSVPATGTLVETYLATRGITITPPLSIRFQAAHEHWTRNGESWDLDYTGPAMIAGCQNLEGKIVAVQRTWLTKDGTAKAKLDPPRKTVGTPRGAAVRLGRVNGHLFVAEGVETGLTVLENVSEGTVWCTLGTSGMRSVEVPDHVHKVTFCCDGDAASLGAAKSAAKRLMSDTRECFIWPSERGEDVNDLVRPSVA